MVTDTAHFTTSLHMHSDKHQTLEEEKGTVLRGRSDDIRINPIG